MKNAIKTALKPIRHFFTRALVDVNIVESEINRITWKANNAFRWMSAYVVKNQILGDYLEFGVWKGNSFIEAYEQLSDYSETFYGPRGTVQKAMKDVKNPFMKTRFHAFDSFQGLSSDPSGNAPLQYFAGNYSSSQQLFEKIFIHLASQERE